MHYEENINDQLRSLHNSVEESDPQTPSEEIDPILESVPDTFDEITTNQDHDENFDAAVDAFLEYYCDPDNPEYIFGESEPEEN